MAGKQKFSDDELIELAHIHKRPGPPVSYNTTQIAAALGVRRSAVQERLARLASQGRLGMEPVLPGFGIKQTANLYDESGEVQKTWIKQRPVGEAFELPEGHKIAGVSALIDSEGREIQKWVKTKEENHETQLTREAVMEAVKNWKGKSEILLPPTGCDPKRLALYPTADRHLGLLSWHKDSEADWDLKIAEHKIIEVTAELIHLTPKTRIAVMLDLGDQFHMNDQSNATPMNKNRLDVDGRFPKVARAGVKLRKVELEMMLQHHEYVVYAAVSGNHDPEAQMWLSIALAEHFENNPRVIISTEPSEFWHYEFGKVFLFANHGHKTKPDALPPIMATDYPDVWARTEHRYAFSGHIHKERSGEVMKTRWETLRTLTPGDNYAHTHGWRSCHELTSITYSAEKGQRHRQFVPA